MYGQGWCIGSWLGVIGSLSVGLHHLDACGELAKKSSDNECEEGIKDQVQVYEHIM